MTTTPPNLFDWRALALRRDRAMRMGFLDSGAFLHREVGAGLAARLGDITRRFQDTLMVGTGGGVLSEALTSALGGASIRGVDLSPSMAAVSAADLMESEVLPVSAGSHDLAISSLMMHWTNDPVGHLVQLRRALRPDGLVMAALFGGQTLSELRAALAEAESEITGGLSPRIAPMAEIRDLGGLLQRAGLAMPVADSERLTVTYASSRALMQDLRRMGETNVLSARRGGLTRAILDRTEAIYRHHFPAEDGRIRATFEIIFLTGWAPGPDQPVPLRPGSAKARLADALGTVEIDPRPSKPRQ